MYITNAVETMVLCNLQGNTFLDLNEEQKVGEIHAWLSGIMNNLKYVYELPL